MALTPDTSVKLGDFTFQEFEVPERMPFGGHQALRTHDLVGGTRVVDSMGGFEDRIEWSGLIMTPKGSQTGAVSRAKRLDSLRRAGQQLVLTWHEFTYTVLIETFVAEFERFYQIPYKIGCLVVQVGTAAPASSDIGLDQMCRADMGSINSLVGSITSGPLSSIGSLTSGLSSLGSLTSTLSGAVGAVSDFAQATTSTINGVLAPLGAVQAQVGTLIASVGNTVSNLTTLGGVLPYNQIAQQAAGLTSSVAAYTQTPLLLNLQSTLGRMSSNLSNATTSGQSLTVAGGDLMKIAASQYNDATAWSAIATANGLKDPVLSGINTIVLPVQQAVKQLGGVLGG